MHYESHTGPDDRLTQTRVLLDAIDRARAGLPVLIGGDFNTNTMERARAERRAASPRRCAPIRPAAFPMPYEPMFAELQARGYEWETCNVIGEATQRTRPDGTPPPPHGRIDWFFARGLDCDDPATIPAVDAGASPSPTTRRSPSPSARRASDMSFLPLAAKPAASTSAPTAGTLAAPENTLPAFEAAAAGGATVLEIDVVLTRDEQIVLLHDEVLDRTTDGKGRVADHRPCGDPPPRRRRLVRPGVRRDARPDARRDTRLCPRRPVSAS